MRLSIVLARRVSQAFFFALFLWFCVVATVGPAWFQLRGWPINWLLTLDPLAAVGTLFATGTVLSGLFWGLLAIVVTVFVGRAFCGFVCPLGALNQFTGWLARLGRGHAELAQDHRHRPAQGIKFLLLAFFLAAALAGPLLTGLLDPLPLIHRSANLLLAPILDRPFQVLATKPRYYEHAWTLGAAFLAVVLANLAVPRFFCRVLCPAGALFGLLNRFTPWRIGKSKDKCGDCHLCETRCEGGCHLSGRMRTSECVLCFNCLDVCPAGRITFAGKPSAAGENPRPDASRRGFIAAGAAGLLAAPVLGLTGLSGPNNNPHLIRPPGSLDEDRFLARCIRCGQCMRACPSNVIHPALTEAGLEGLWTPRLNYRLGSSGCQPNCVACGNVCPTAAIRPLSIEEKQGRGDFAVAGPVRLGTAFVDRTRCLPWAMDRPCIVCQELCPVSPKAIFTRVVFAPVRGGAGKVSGVKGRTLTLSGLALTPLNLGSGDYYLKPAGRPEAGPVQIAAAGQAGFVLARDPSWPEPPAQGQAVEIVVRLQQPHVDPARCIGCGLCEHECPISGLRGIRVTSENESRSRRTRMLA
jgi:polyferredoxin